ncbi:oxidoreductase [Trypanosoma theileri]|uniref:Oxidoreductase n=1 Tax=Trypanosoma theileri TaxID=67003 RepID=A0A1X0NRR2_9TRYP|nr:oxidoreductase [Trypanosoma theileri]ORC86869.1 oxidoreductase [Trypanosoma theileri]
MGAANSQPSETDFNGDMNAGGITAIRCEGWTVPKCVRSWSSSAVVCSDEVVVPPPGPDQVRVKVFAAGVNPIDVKRITFGASGIRGLFRWGGSNGNNGSSNMATLVNSKRHPSPTFPFPYVMGIDGAGVVESVGWSSDDTERQQKYNLQVGDRVAFLADITSAHGGSFCQYAVVHADAVGKIPPPTKEDIIDFVEAAAIPTAVGTAYVALFDKLSVQPGRSIFISGASGGVGSAAVQLAKYAGLCVLASCSTVNVSYVREELGADHVFDYTAVDVVEECLKRTMGFGVDYVLEVADAGLAVQHAEALRFGGSICVLPGLIPHTSDIFFRQQLTLSYVCLSGLYGHPITRENVRRVIEVSLALYQSGAFRFPLLETVPVERAETALEIVSTGHARGKIVLTDYHPPENEKERKDSQVIGTRRRSSMKKYHLAGTSASANTTVNAGANANININVDIGASATTGPVSTSQDPKVTAAALAAAAQISAIATS